MTAPIRRIAPHRRRALAALGAVATGPLATPSLHAQAWPARPVRLIVPYPPGGNGDILGRAIGAKLGEVLGQPVVVESRPGAGAAIGAAYVAKAAPDGYTLLLGDIATHAINPVAQPALPYDPNRELVPVAQMSTVSLLLLVHPSMPVRNATELIAYARARPGRLSYASAGTGTQSHLAMEMLKAVTGTFMVHVPYKGSAPALADLAGGQVHLMIDGAAAAFVKSGRLRALAATGGRSPAFPEVPLLSDTVPGFRFESWQGIFAPAGTPPEIVRRLEAEIVRGLADPALARRFTDLGIQPTPRGAVEFGGFIASEQKRIVDLVKSRGLAMQD